MHGASRAQSTKETTRRLAITRGAAGTFGECGVGSGSAARSPRTGSATVRRPTRPSTRCWRKGYFTHMRTLGRLPVACGCYPGEMRAHSQPTSCKLNRKYPTVRPSRRKRLPPEPQRSLRPTCSLARGSGQPQQTSPPSQLLSEVRAGVRTRPRRQPPTIPARAADDDLRTLLGKRLCSLGPCTPKERLATPSTRARASGHGL